MKEFEFELIERGTIYLECAIDGCWYQLQKFNAIPTEPYYEPFFGWFVAEAWEGDGCLLILYHSVGPAGEDKPTKEVDWSTINGADFFTNCKCKGTFSIEEKKQ